MTVRPRKTSAAGTHDPDRAPLRRRGRPSNASTDETVAAVLVAARRQFAARGYAATTNRTVADDAGLTHTAIYNHFGSKARLFLAVFVDVQNLLIEELERSARAVPTEPAIPRALLDAIEALRAADPSYVEFLTSMYVEVRRHPQLREVFQGGEPFPIVDLLRRFSAGPVPGTPIDDPEGSMWFWIAFALGLAQLSALADPETFAGTVRAFRRQFASTTVTRPDPPDSPGGTRS